MAGCGTTFKFRDRQRYRKVYPYLRRTPRYAIESEKDAVIEVGEITFTNTDKGSYTFTVPFPGAPIITATAHDFNGNDTADVNVFVVSVSTSVVELKTSDTFTGRVSFHAIYVDCST